MVLVLPIRLVGKLRRRRRKRWTGRWRGTKRGLEEFIFDQRKYDVWTSRQQH